MSRKKKMKMEYRFYEVPEKTARFCGFCTVITKEWPILWFFPKIRSEVFILSSKNYIIWYVP